MNPIRDEGRLQPTGGSVDTDTQWEEEVGSDDVDTGRGMETLRGSQQETRGHHHVCGSDVEQIHPVRRLVVSGLDDLSHRVTSWSDTFDLNGQHGKSDDLDGSTHCVQVATADSKVVAPESRGEQRCRPDP